MTSDQVEPSCATRAMPIEVPGSMRVSSSSISRADEGDQPFGEISWNGFVARREMDEDELVAAQPNREVLRPGGCAQTAGDLDENEIAGAVAEGVVDVFEVVEIEHVEEDAAPRPAPRRDALFEQPCQMRPIVEARQGVVMRLAAQRSFRVLDLHRLLREACARGCRGPEDAADDQGRQQRETVHQARRRRSP